MIMVEFDYNSYDKDVNILLGFLFWMREQNCSWNMSVGTNKNENVKVRERSYVRVFALQKEICAVLIYYFMKAYYFRMGQ